jgi:uncharacterized protein
MKIPRFLSLLAVFFLFTLRVYAEGPSFSCAKVEASSIEEMVCKDDELSRLDRELAGVYAAAQKKAVNEHPTLLKAEQRGWVKGRNDCWKGKDKRQCVADNYRLRTAELQARYRLLEGKGPFTYTCDGDERNEVIVMFFATNPPTLQAERGDSVSLMYQYPTASGTLYQGRNEIFREHQGIAAITWGYGEKEMQCKQKS